MDIRLSQITVQLPPDGKTLFRLAPLTVPQGSKILIQGPSGKGKTTLLHIIAGLYTATEGYVFWNDRNLNESSENELCSMRRQHFGMVFQKLNLLPHLTAFENVILPLPQTAEAKDSAMHSLALLKLTGKENTRAGNLSLGEQQRVAVARTVAKAPEVILADEPTSSLDDESALAVIENLLAVTPKQTVVVVSHDHRVRGAFPNNIEFSSLLLP